MKTLLTLSLLVVAAARGWASPSPTIPPGRSGTP